MVSRSGELNYQNLSDRFGCRSFFLINTTPVGMSPGCNATPLDLREFPQCLGVADVVYNPLRTRLCQQAAALGIPACGGLLMLAAQAAAAEYAFGAAVPKPETVLRICGELRREQENLVLIGMPGSGKTTVGQRAARLMDREFIDCDERYLAEYGILSHISGSGRLHCCKSSLCKTAVLLRRAAVRCCVPKMFLCCVRTDGCACCSALRHCWRGRADLFPAICRSCTGSGCRCTLRRRILP